MTTGPLSEKEMEPLRKVQQVYLKYHLLICEMCDARQHAIFASEDNKDKIVSDEDRARVDTLIDIAHGLQLIYDALQQLEIEYKLTRGELLTRLIGDDNEETLH